MNKNREYNLWAYRKIFVSGILTAMLVLAGLLVLFPLSSNTVVGYTMPGNVEWDMDDLVANSSGAVTSPAISFYTVHEDIEITLNSTLTVNTGQTVYFDLGTGFSVYGYLTAAGSNVSSIRFTSSESNPSFGDWNGISFRNGSGGIIDYVSISYAENGIEINNTMLSAIMNSEFEYNVWGIRAISGYCMVTGSTFAHNGIFPHPDPPFSNGGGILIEEGSTGSVSGNDFISNIGGIRVSQSHYYYIMNNYIYNNTAFGILAEAGDYWNQTYVNIYNNDIISNPNFGIYASLGYDSYIDNNNITDNRVGIYIEGRAGGTTGGGIYGNYIAYNSENGIECYDMGDPGGGNSPNISGNDIIGNGISGIYCKNSSPSIEYNDFIMNQFGVYGDGATPIIESCFFGENDFAVWANASNIQVTDSEIPSSTYFDYFLENDGYITSLNTTFNDHAVGIHDSLSTLEVKWYLHILVINGSGPVSGADVTVSDNENGTWSQLYKTDSSGRVKWIVVTEYIRTLTDWIFYTPHNITATKGPEVGYAEPIMDISKFVVIDLGPGVPPPIPPQPPVDLIIVLMGADLWLGWGPSPDEGGGEGDVVEYIIYRAVSVDGPYFEVGTVFADGSMSYSWIDSGVGDGEWNNYFYIVRAKDSEGLEDDNENKVGKFVSPLEIGWNLISIPLVQSDTTRETVLQTLGTNYVTVQGYHAGKSRPWLHWHRWKPHYFNSVIEMDHMKSYYIDMEIADHLVTVGKVAPETEINLKSGWNLVGYPCLTPQLRDDALSSISGNYNMVERFDTTKDKEVRLTSSDYMEPGVGYWIHATADCTWVVTN
jgi:parallel beta-helix repeat protein